MNFDQHLSDKQTWKFFVVYHTKKYIYILASLGNFRYLPPVLPTTMYRHNDLSRKQGGKLNLQNISLKKKKNNNIKNGNQDFFKN